MATFIKGEHEEKEGYGDLEINARQRVYKTLQYFVNFNANRGESGLIVKIVDPADPKRTDFAAELTIDLDERFRLAGKTYTVKSAVMEEVKETILKIGPDNKVTDDDWFFGSHWKRKKDEEFEGGAVYTNTRQHYKARANKNDKTGEFELISFTGTVSPRSEFSKKFDDILLLFPEIPHYAWKPLISEVIVEATIPGTIVQKFVCAVLFEKHNCAYTLENFFYEADAKYVALIKEALKKQNRTLAGAFMAIIKKLLNQNGKTNTLKVGNDQWRVKGIDPSKLKDAARDLSRWIFWNNAERAQEALDEYVNYRSRKDGKPKVTFLQYIGGFRDNEEKNIYIDEDYWHLHKEKETSYLIERYLKLYPTKEEQHRVLLLDYLVNTANYGWYSPWLQETTKVSEMGSTAASLSLAVDHGLYFKNLK